VTAEALKARVRVSPRARRAADELGVDLSTLDGGDDPIRLADVVVAAELSKHDDRPSPGAGTDGVSSWRSPPRVASFEVDCAAWWQPDIDVAALVRGAVDAALVEHPLLDSQQVRVVPLDDMGDAVGVVTLPPLAPGEVIVLGHSAVGLQVVAVTLPDGSYAVRVRPQALLGLLWDETALGATEPVAFARRVQQNMVLGPGRQD
jgi:hypothetical protein